MDAIYCLSQGTVLHGKSYDYKIVKTLGQGSFGITYLAVVQMRGELGSIDATVYVAIKEFFMHEINGREGSTVTSGSKTGVYDKYKGKFIKEAINLSKLHHRNIIRVVEAFEANNTVYYAMEYVNGGSLDDLIRTSNGLSETETLKYAIQIGEALRFMHSMNMLHLDLKPSNVMIREGGAVLIDFGLSKQYDEDGNPESSTTIGGGTAGYAPLEQTNYIGDKKNGLPATMDIYAFGATVFKMLTGHKPPVASDILNDGFPESDLSAKGVCKRLSSNIAKCMDPLRKNRAQSMDAVLANLKSIQDELFERTSLEEKKDFQFSLSDYHHPNDRLAPVYGPPIPQNFDDSIKQENTPISDSSAKPVKKNNKMIYLFLFLALIVIGLLVFFFHRYNNTDSTSVQVQTADVVALSDSTQSSGIGCNPVIPSDFVLVPGGVLKNVSEWSKSDGSDEITYSLNIDSLYISKYELTQKGYRQIMDTITDEQMTYEVWEPQKRFVEKGDSLPVQLLLREAMDYCNKRSKLEGYDGFYKFSGDTVMIDVDGNGYRLPHHMEWLYAARGGNLSDGYHYSGSNKLKEVAWYAGNSGLKPHKIGQLKPNELGLYDMTGNSSEFNGTSGDFSYWHTPMFTNDAYFNYNLPLKKVLDKDYWKDYGEWRNGVRLVLIPKNIINKNLLLKSKKKQSSEYW